MCVWTRALKSRARCDLNGRPPQRSRRYTGCALRVCGRFGDNDGIRDWSVSKWRNRGCSVPPTQILAGYLFARSGPPSRPRMFPDASSRLLVQYAPGDYSRSRYQSDTKFFDFFEITCFSRPRASADIGHELFVDELFLILKYLIHMNKLTNWHQVRMLN